MVTGDYAARLYYLRDGPLAARVFDSRANAYPHPNPTVWSFIDVGAADDVLFAVAYNGQNTRMLAWWTTLPGGTKGWKAVLGVYDIRKVDACAGGALVARTDNSVWFYNSAGKTWVQVGDPIPGLEDVAIYPDATSPSLFAPWAITGNKVYMWTGSLAYWFDFYSPTLCGSLKAIDVATGTCPSGGGDIRVIVATDCYAAGEADVLWASVCGCGSPSCWHGTSGWYDDSEPNFRDVAAAKVDISEDWMDE